MSVKNFGLIIITIILFNFVNTRFSMLTYSNEINSYPAIRHRTYEVFANKSNFANDQLQNFTVAELYADRSEESKSKKPSEEQESSITVGHSNDENDKEPPSGDKDVTPDIWDDTPPPPPPPPKKE